MTAAYPVTSRNRLRRRYERGRYDRDTVHAILDAAMICHIAYVIDGQPFCTPTSFWREDDRLYWHGSSASRMVRAQAKGIPVCLTVTHHAGDQGDLHPRNGNRGRRGKDSLYRRL